MKVYAKEENGITPYEVMLTQEGARKPLDLTATLSAGGWSSQAPYTQTVTVAGMLATDTPLVDVVLSDVAATALAQLDAYGLVGRIDTGTDTIVATCYERKPETNFTLTMKVVR